MNEKEKHDRQIKLLKLLYEHKKEQFTYDIIRKLLIERAPSLYGKDVRALMNDLQEMLKTNLITSDYPQDKPEIIRGYTYRLGTIGTDTVIENRRKKQYSTEKEKK